MKLMKPFGLAILLILTISLESCNKKKVAQEAAERALPKSWHFWKRKLPAHSIKLTKYPIGRKLGTTPKTYRKLDISEGQSFGKTTKPSKFPTMPKFEYRAIGKEITEYSEKEEASASTPTLTKTVDGKFTFQQGKNLPVQNYQLNRIKSKAIKIEGNFTQGDFESLAHAGVKFVYNGVFKEELSKIKNFKVISIFSEDVAVMMRLYDLNEFQARQMINRLSHLLQDPTIIKVASHNQMTRAIKNLNGATPVLIFHNQGGKIFGKSIEKYGIRHFLSCESYKLGTSSPFLTTAKIDVEHTIKSVAKLKKNNLNDFLQDFAIEYIENENKEIRKNVFLVGSGTMGTGGGIVAINRYFAKK